MLTTCPEQKLVLLDQAEREPNDILAAQAASQITKTNDIVHCSDYRGATDFALYLFPLFHTRVPPVLENPHHTFFIDNDYLRFHDLVEGTRLHLERARYCLDGTT
jgi:hypothetical protein